MKKSILFRNDFIETKINKKLVKLNYFLIQFLDICYILYKVINLEIPVSLYMFTCGNHNDICLDKPSQKRKGTFFAKYLFAGRE